MHKDMYDLIKNIPSNPLDLNAYQIANFLNIAGIILVENLKREANKSPNDTGYIFNDFEFELIESIFKELSDNFFPMAHSQKPLRDIEIKEKQDVADLRSLIEVTEYKMGEMSDIFNDLRSCIRRLEG